MLDGNDVGENGNECFQRAGPTSAARLPRREGPPQKRACRLHRLGVGLAWGIAAGLDGLQTVGRRRNRERYIRSRRRQFQK